VVSLTSSSGGYINGSYFYKSKLLTTT
jgi:hypothetical protein